MKQVFRVHPKPTRAPRCVITREPPPSQRWVGRPCRWPPGTSGWVWLLLLCAPLGPLACSHAHTQRAAEKRDRSHLALGSACGSPLFLTAPKSMSAADQQWVRSSLPQACQRLRAYSLQLRLPTEIRLYSTPEEFRGATGKRPTWLRAWASFRVVHLTMPSTWRTKSPVAQVERLAHELSHVAVFQSFGNEHNARMHPLPLWFLEGTASVIAEQGARRMPIQEVCRHAGTQNPLEARALWKKNHQLLYGAGHAALSELVRQNGTAIVGNILRDYQAVMRNGESTTPFETALRARTGTTPHAIWGTLCPDIVSGPSPQP